MIVTPQVQPVEQSPDAVAAEDASDREDAGDGEIFSMISAKMK